MLRSSTAAKVWLLIILNVLVDGCSLTVFGPLRHILGQVVGVTQPLWDGLAADRLEPSIQQDSVLYRAPRRGARRLRGMFALRNCLRARLDTLLARRQRALGDSCSPASIPSSREQTLWGALCPPPRTAQRRAPSRHDLPSSGCVQAAPRLRRPLADPACAGCLRGRPFDTGGPLTVAPFQRWLGALRSGPDQLLHYRHSGQLVLQAWPPSASAGRSPALRVCG